MSYRSFCSHSICSMFNLCCMAYFHRPTQNWTLLSLNGEYSITLIVHLIAKCVTLSPSPIFCFIQTKHINSTSFCFEISRTRIRRKSIILELEWMYVKYSGSALNIPDHKLKYVEPNYRHAPLVRSEMFLNSLYQHLHSKIFLCSMSTFFHLYPNMHVKKVMFIIYIYMYI